MAYGSGISLINLQSKVFIINNGHLRHISTQTTLLINMMNDALIIFAKQQVEIAMLQLQNTRSFFEKIKGDSHTQNSEFQWVYIEKLAEATGLSINGIRNRVSRKKLVEGIHYRKEKPGSKNSRLLFNITEIDRYLGGN
jgi:hypothetical protein